MKGIYCCKLRFGLFQKAVPYHQERGFCHRTQILSNSGADCDHGHQEKTAAIKLWSRLRKEFKECDGFRKYYNYLLINTVEMEPSSSISLDQFRKSIFYAGKGCGDRVYWHVKDAYGYMMYQNHFKGQNKMMDASNLSVVMKIRRKDDADAKLQKIIDIWSAGKGLVIIIFLTNSHEQEAYEYESLIIDSISNTPEHELLNKNTGQRGVINFSNQERLLLGDHLLDLAYDHFVKENQIDKWFTSKQMKEWYEYGTH